ncbi:MAG: IS3 family transposase [Lachnospirales bacterium]
MHINDFRSFSELEKNTFSYIEGFYNNNRIHQALNYLTPRDFFNNYFINLAA